MKKRWVPIALAAFVIVDIVLVYLAFRHTRSGDAASAETQSATTSAGPDDATSPTGGGSPSAAGTPSANGLALVSMGSDNSVLRATTGSCEGGPPAVLEVSTDGGQTFETVAGTTPGILRVIAKSQANLQYVGADHECKPALYQSVDGGETWSKGPSEGTWHLAPEGDGLIGPDGPVDPGCQPVSLSVLSRDAVFIACEDDTVRSTADAGAEWQTAGTLADIASVSFLSSRNGYALSVGEQCGAEVSRTTDGGVTWSPVGCIQGTTPQALDAIGQLVVATVDGQAHLSSDGGATWN
ncbi:hypothetical protein [Blastococcus sp. Marseille-P5729]|uniref:hypothetical protein n=1 Tax=Blastococcus sp. Marseille-P5729 TaxID=2086582 RepID=UPI000D0E5224|nr:hypothetical protein [Blastococcus sp. Marseille-P5729]